MSSRRAQRVAAVVLAGKGKDDPLTGGRVAAKALVDFNGKPIVQYVLEALRATTGVIGTIYVGPTTAAVASQVDHCVPQGENVTGSVENGLTRALEAYPEASHILVLTGDLPWLEPAALEDFLKSAPSVPLVYAIIAKEVMERQFPGQKRTYARLKDGTFTGGNIYLLEPWATAKFVPLIERFYAVRKSPLAIAKLVGVRTLFKFALGSLTIADAEARIRELAGAEARVYRTPYASIGADVDKPSHLLVTPAELPNV